MKPRSKCMREEEKIGIDSKRISIDRSICRGCVENLLRMCRVDREYKNFSRWIEDLSRFLSRLKKEGLIEKNLLRICQEAVKFEEKRFFKERKNTKR